MLLFLFTGGIRIITIKDQFGKLMHWEPLNSSETVRPYFLINGAENVENVEKICVLVDEDLEKLKNYLVVPYNNTTLMCNIEFIPSWDGKLIRT